MKKSRINLYLSNPVAKALKAYCQKQGYSYGEALEPIIWHYFQSFAPTGAPPQTQTIINDNRANIDDNRDSIDNTAKNIDDVMMPIDSTEMPIDEEPMPMPEMPEPDSYQGGKRYATRTLHH